MYTEDVLRIALAGEGSDGFLISYPRELGSVVKDEEGKSDDKDMPMPGSSDVTRFAPSAEAAAKVVAAILTKAQNDAKKEHPRDVFDNAFKKAVKEV